MSNTLAITSAVLTQDLEDLVPPEYIDSRPRYIFCAATFFRDQTEKLLLVRGPSGFRGPCEIYRVMTAQPNDFSLIEGSFDLPPDSDIVEAIPIELENNSCGLLAIVKENRSCFLAIITANGILKKSAEYRPKDSPLRIVPYSIEGMAEVFFGKRGEERPDRLVKIKLNSLEEVSSKKCQSFELAASDEGLQFATQSCGFEESSANERSRPKRPAASISYKSGEDSFEVVNRSTSERLDFPRSSVWSGVSNFPFAEINSVSSESTRQASSLVISRLKTELVIFGSAPNCRNSDEVNSNRIGLLFASPVRGQSKLVLDERIFTNRISSIFIWQQFLILGFYGSYRYINLHGQ